mmetsp:Transcript_6171/g.10576  ORF Transcript_6171/g.10576 Transcript_6171/m.10576 type:complete len:92 (+) Transcript_6171:792-1067(+)
MEIDLRVGLFVDALGSVWVYVEVKLGFFESNPYGFNGMHFWVIFLDLRLVSITESITLLWESEYFVIVSIFLILYVVFLLLELLFPFFSKP